MSLDRREIRILAGVAREYLAKVDDTTVTISANLGVTRNQLAVLINRFYREFPGAGTPPEVSES